jgi:hypothetical protein
MHEVMRRQLVAFGILGMVLGTPIVGAPAISDDPVPEASAPVAIQRATVPVPRLRDEVAMVLAGTALIGLAAAVRRAA